MSICADQACIPSPDMLRHLGVTEAALQECDTGASASEEGHQPEGLLKRICLQ